MYCLCFKILVWPLDKNFEANLPDIVSCISGKISRIYVVYIVFLITQFKSFSDRVADIDVDVYHKIGMCTHCDLTSIIGRTQLEPDDDADSFFNQALREWYASSLL